MFRFPMVQVDALLQCSKPDRSLSYLISKLEFNSKCLNMRITTYVSVLFLCHLQQASKARQDNEKHRIHYLEANH
jgi:hypothetical protein